MKKIGLVEHTFVMIKPDGVKRGLVGRLFRRFEEAGLKLVAARMIRATEEQAKNNYPGTDTWLKKMGEKTLVSNGGNIEEVKKAYGTDDLLEVGKVIYMSLVKMLTSGPVILTVWEGEQVIKRVRSITGGLEPTVSNPGTIRHDLGIDTPVLAQATGRKSLANVIHASDSYDEAKREIRHWFGDKFKDLGNYELMDLSGLFDESW
ncbi:nucleoside-diphosphate kinase [Candidatus Dojkabacteria bacterium]|nr:nucleoside-diphosphate kinase [Candidatus Dojkabacteria bacterium]